MHQPEWQNAPRAMERRAVDAVIAAHAAAETAGNVSGLVALYTDNVIHDVIAGSTVPTRGRAALTRFYAERMHNLQIQTLQPCLVRYGNDHCVLGQVLKGTMTGHFLNIAGQQKTVSFRVMRVWDFRDGLIAQETLWLDGLTMLDQLGA